jgi:arylsulfatase/arylsulfatase A
MLVPCAVLCLVASSGHVDAPAAGAGGPPSILLVMTDDQGAGDLGCAGNPLLDTPHLDRLARESTSFRRFYVSPVCTPTRASLMTGRASARTRAIDTWRGRAMMDPSEITIAEVLREAGYATGLFGKWHLGDCHPMRPMDQGFDRVLMHRGGGLAQPSDPIGNGRRYTDAILLRDGVEVETTGYCMDVYVDEAIAFMEESRAAGRPFFAYVATNTPHGPFHDVPEAAYAKYRGRDLASMVDAVGRVDAVARTFAMVENIDRNVGRLLAALDGMEAADDTIVLYLHDNGPAIARYVGRMRGTKATVLEGGIRTPFFVRWPGRVPAGVVREEIAAHVDVWPTLVEAAGARPPEGTVIDGRSLLPLLEARDEPWPDRRLFIQAHRGDERVARHQFAVIGPRYKLLRASGFGHETLPAAAAPIQLFDLLDDPYERHDLAAAHPDVVADMLAAHDAWFADVTGEGGHGTPPRIVVGTAAEPRTVLTRNDWRPTEGGGYGTAGSWWLRLPEATTLEARVRFRRAVESPTVAVTVGPVAREVSAAGAVTEVPLGAFELPAGACELTVRVTSGGAIVAPEHVILAPAP